VSEQLLLTAAKPPVPGTEAALARPITKPPVLGTEAGLVPTPRLCPRLVPARDGVGPQKPAAVENVTPGRRQHVQQTGPGLNCGQEARANASQFTSSREFSL